MCVCVWFQSRSSLYAVTSHLSHLAMRRTPSPARNPPSRFLHVDHLTRPFTQLQLHELLTEDGEIIKEFYWTNRIKSHCIAVVSCHVYVCICVCTSIDDDCIQSLGVAMVTMICAVIDNTYRLVNSITSRVFLSLCSTRP